MTTADDIVTQVRLDIAELKGMVNVVINEHTRRIAEQETVAKQLRTDLTAVNDNIHQRINTLMEQGNQRGGEMQQAITTNQANITDIKADIVEIQNRQVGTGLRLASYTSPVISFFALLISIYLIVKK